jgi:bacillithiol system protein YtxJ
MHPALTPLKHIDELDRLLTESDDRPLVVFKHSYTCGISAEALDELVAHLSGRHVDEARYAVVTVQTHRDVSNAVAAKLGVRHETPQALVIREGQVVWAASHFRVTANAVSAAIKKAAAQ